MHHLNRCVLKVAEDGVVRLKDTTVKCAGDASHLRHPAGRCPSLRLGVQDDQVRAKNRYWPDRIQRLELGLFNCNAVLVRVGQPRRNFKEGYTP